MASRIDWSRWDDLLGTAPDAVIAEAIGCAQSTVCARRTILGIAALHPKTKPLHPKTKTIAWGEWDRLLGTTTDTALAEAIGCSRGAVIYRRRRLGIKSFRSKRKLDRSKWDRLLGTMPDTALAQKIGCSSVLIWKWRKELGIQSYRRRR